MPPPGYHWKRSGWYMVLQHEGQAVASVNLSPGRDRPYSVAYVALGTSQMGGTSHETRMAAIRHCERWAWRLAGPGLTTSR